MTDVLERIEQRAAEVEAKKDAMREKLKQRHPEIHAFIVELEKVFGPVTGRVKNR